MALAAMKTLLKQEAAENRGRRAFSVGNMEMVKGAVQAAREAKVDVAVHLDHGLTIETVERTLELGFTSVMPDASTLLFEENMEKTRQVVEITGRYGATVEA